MRQLLLIALRNLATHRRRTLLLGGAIAGTTALLVVLLGLSNGIRATMLESATTLMTGHVNVGGFYKITAGQSAPVVVNYPKLLEQVRAELPELSFAVQRGRGWVKVVSEQRSLQVGVSGIDVLKEAGFRKVVRVLEGRLEDLAQQDTVLLFEEQARRLEVKVGDTLTLSAPTMRGTNNTVDVRVAAIASNVGMLSNFNLYVPDTTLRSLYRLRPDATGALMLYLSDMESIPAVQARLRERLPALGYQLLDHSAQPFFQKFQVVNREPWTGQRLDITTWEDEMSFLTWTLTVLDVLTFILTVVLMVIIAVGIMNTLWIAIRERTREIGTLRAIGMQRGWVVLMFVLEALCLGLLGTLVGAAAGLGVCAALNAAHVELPLAAKLFVMSDTLHLVVKPLSVVGAVLLLTGCTTAISLIPSFLAARLKPVTAMHHIG
jgi:putative ABC transport system permease protein